MTSKGAGTADIESNRMASLNLEASQVPIINVFQVSVQKSTSVAWASSVNKLLEKSTVSCDVV